MASPTNHWKLGLFVIVGFVGALGTILYFGAQSLRKETVQYMTYFDESVQGLEVGSPVKFRGVTVGTVSHIDLASDHRHIQVACDLAVTVLDTLGLSKKGLKPGMNISSDLRAQLAAAGITGVKFIQMDFFPAKDNPPAKLPFSVPANHIPAAPSVMKNLEDSVVHAVDSFPALADQLLVVLVKVGALLQDVQDKKLPDRANATMTHLDQVLTDLHTAITGLESGKLSKNTQEVLARMNGEKGLLASIQRTSDAMGSMAQNASHVGPTLEDTMRDMQAAAIAIRRLATSLDTDPDMLIKGRAKRVTK